ncbi:50S ribosomal protein L9 [Mycoplasmoides alvi]|uniref:50S ribosomal protein L9 n=1 Tax=Mycoplasmoides alvi TaxID=78580 RepID=UPI00051BF495|nr:50S ribosomal protein L9 [Mycoplasmoides alvi]
MKVILLHDVPKLGKANSIVDAKDGYAKNYLFKNKLAVPLTESNQKTLENHLKRVAQEHDTALVQANLLKKQIEQVELKFSLTKNKNDKIFGSISKKQIIDALITNNIDCSSIYLPENLKLTVGNHQIKIKIFEKIYALLKIYVEVI